MDEIYIKLDSSISYDWIPKNTKKLVKINRSTQKECVIGAVLPDSGKTFYTQSEKINSHVVSTFLKEFSENYKEKHNVIILDNASYHISQNTKDFPIPENITLFYLPRYSPDLNPIERLWKYLRDNCFNNKFFENKLDLKITAYNSLRKLQEEKDLVKNICGNYRKLL